MGKDPGPGGGGGWGGGGGGFTLPGHRSGDPAAIGISRRAPTEICPWLNPPPPCSAEKGQLLPQTPGRSRWPCWLPAGVRGTGQGWWPGPIKPSSPQAQPIPCGCRRRVDSHGRTPGSHAGGGSGKLRGPAEPQVPRGSSLPPRSQGQPVPSRVAPEISPFPTARHAGRDVPGNFLRFPSLQGLWGKQERAKAPLQGDTQPRSRASHPGAGRSPRAQPPERGPSVRHSTRQEAAACLRPAPLRARGTKEGPLGRPGPAPALDILLFGG